MIQFSVCDLELRIQALGFKVISFKVYDGSSGLALGSRHGFRPHG